MRSPLTAPLPLTACSCAYQESTNNGCWTFGRTKSMGCSSKKAKSTRRRLTRCGVGRTPASVLITVCTSRRTTSQDCDGWPSNPPLSFQPGARCAFDRRRFGGLSSGKGSLPPLSRSGQQRLARRTEAEADVIERILRGHQSEAMVGRLWEGPLRTNAGPRPPPDQSQRVSTEPAIRSSSRIPNTWSPSTRSPKGKRRARCSWCSIPISSNASPDRLLFFTGNTGSTRGARRRPAVNTHARGVQSDSVGIGTKLDTKGDVYQRQTADHVALPHSRHETTTYR